jgi:ParB-like chromosome segregation protein Spo0J
MHLPIYKISLHPERRGLGAIPSPSPECVSHLNDYGPDGVSPLLVEPAGEAGSYWLVTGERWWIAAQSTNVEELPVQIFKGGSEEAISLLRADFVKDANPIQLAKLAQQLQKGRGGKPLQVTEVARMLRMQRSTVAHLLRLLTLVPEIQEKLIQGTLTPSKVKPLVGLPPDIQRQIADRIQGKGWTVRRIEELAAVVRDPKRVRERVEKNKKKDDPNRVRIERLISEALGMPARLEGEGERGALTLEYGNLDVLSGLLERLGIAIDD